MWCNAVKTCWRRVVVRGAGGGGEDCERGRGKLVGIENNLDGLYPRDA